MEKRYDPLELGLPVAIESEIFVLGSLLLSEDASEELRQIRPPLTVDEFSTQERKLIWGTLCHLADEGVRVNRDMVVQKLMDSRQLEEAGGMAGIASYEGVPGVNLDGEVKILLNRSARRHGMGVSDVGMKRFASGDGDPAQIAAWMRQALIDTSLKLSNDTFCTVDQIIESAGGLDSFLANRSKNVVPVPWQALSILLSGSGFRGGQLIILAARPGQGKSAMALALAKHAARQTGKAIAIFSLEMGQTELAERLLAMESGISTRKLAHAAQNGCAHKISAAKARMTEERLLISDKTAQSPSAISAYLRRLATQEPIGMVVVDYLQLIEVSGRENRATALGQVSRGLKLLAEELDVPILALSQLNRDCMKEDREPELSDLRESGAIEQDADIVAMIHYTQKCDFAAGIHDGDLKLLVRKQRSGPEGAVRLIFHAPTTTFREPGEPGPNGREGQYFRDDTTV